MCRKHATGSIAFGLLIIIASLVPAYSAEAQEGRQGFTLEVSAALVGINEFETNEVAVGLIPRWCWNRPWCFWIDIWWIIGPWPDPWRGVLVIDDFPVPINELEVGPGLMVAPAVEYRFQSGNRLTPSLYGGAGVQWEDGATTTIPGVGEFTTSSTTSPVAIFGGALTYEMNDRTSLRFAAGGSVVFMEDMDITGPNGSRFKVDGEDTFSPIFSVGVQFGF